MKSFIVYEKDKSLAEFLTLTYLKKAITNNWVLKTKKVEEISSTSLFSIPLFDENEGKDNDTKHNDKENDNQDIWGEPESIEYLDYNENDISPWPIENTKNKTSNVTMGTISTVYKINIDNKTDSEKIIRLMDNGELLHRINSSHDVMYCFVFSYVDNSHVKKVQEWASINSVKIISPIIISKRSPMFTIASLARQYGLDKDKSTILAKKAGKNYGVLVPFLNSLGDRDFLSTWLSHDNRSFANNLDMFLPSQKTEKTPLWEWKKCFSENDFEGFSKVILSFEKDYGDVVLIRTMYKSLSDWARIKKLQEIGIDLSDAAQMVNNARIDSSARILLQKKNLTSKDILSLVNIVSNAYDSIMSGKQNKKTLMSTMIVKMWNIMSK